MIYANEVTYIAKTVDDRVVAFVDTRHPSKSGNVFDGVAHGVAEETHLRDGDEVGEVSGSDGEAHERETHKNKCVMFWKKM